jgi:hypothetical protein
MWHIFYDRFKKEYFEDMKGIAFLYVISQFEGQGPYKIGITKYDLYRRFGNYQTAFVDFDILYLVMLPYTQELLLEKLLHNSLELKPYRVEFPKKRELQKTIFSEWFKTNSKGEELDINKIETTMTRILRETKEIEPIFGYNISGNKIERMSEIFSSSKGDPNFGYYKSQNGTLHKLSKKGDSQYNQIYFDNNRIWKGLDFSMSVPETKKKKKLDYADYIGLIVKSDKEDDQGTVIEIKKEKTRTYAVIRWVKPFKIIKNVPVYESKVRISVITNYISGWELKRDGNGIWSEPPKLDDEEAPPKKKSKAKAKSK